MFQENDHIIINIDASKKPILILLHYKTYLSPNFKLTTNAQFLMD